MTPSPIPPAADEPNETGPADRVPSPPSRRSFVQIPAIAFFVFDLILLWTSGRPFLFAIAFAGASAVLVGWFLDRRFKRVLAQWQHARQEALTDAPEDNDAETSTVPTKQRARSRTVRPPVGSWSNPSRSQKFWSRWDKAIPYSRRRRPRG
jgi:hypothetical protein